MYSSVVRLRYTAASGEEGTATAVIGAVNEQGDVLLFTNAHNVFDSVKLRIIFPDFIFTTDGSSATFKVTLHSQWDVNASTPANEGLDIAAVVLSGDKLKGKKLYPVRPAANGVAARDALTLVAGSITLF